MIAPLLFLFFAGTINFSVDPVVYRSHVEIRDTIRQITQEQEIFYIEFNCGIPYHELSYEATDSSIITKAIITFNLANLERPDSLTDTLYRQFTIPSFRAAAQQQISFIVQFGLHIPEGDFRYKVAISSGNKQGSVEKKISINNEDYKISDILLARSITSDTVSHFLRKGNLCVVPHPSHAFNERYNTLHVYYEIYDLAPDSNQLKITYAIQDSSKKIVSQIPRRIAKKFESQAINFGFNIGDLPPGQYFLTITVEDTSTQMTVQKETSFKITGAVQEEVSFAGMPYYEEIEYFLPPKEYKNFLSYSEDGKRRFLDKFWRQHNYYEVAARFEYAEKNFQEGYRPGYKTDRGRIYIKYGEPDDWGRSVLEIEESRPHEHWQYYNGFEFIFVDIHGTNEYTLIWTNDREEESQPWMYKYIPESLLGRIE